MLIALLACSQPQASELGATPVTLGADLSGTVVAGTSLPIPGAAFTVVESIRSADW